MSNSLIKKLSEMKLTTEKSLMTLIMYLDWSMCTLLIWDRFSCSYQSKHQMSAFLCFDQKLGTGSEF